MRKAHIFVEGGGSSKALRLRCESGFRDLLKKCGYTGCMPGITACGPRDVAHDRFKTAHLERKADFVALLVDSEDAIGKNKSPWQHLETPKDNKLLRPAGATEEQVFLMTTSMETWIAADPAALAERYGDKFQTSALPSRHNIEARHRDDVLKILVHATRDCKPGYEKGKHSFELLGKLNYCTLYEKLPSFKRMIGIFDQKLGCSHTPRSGEDTHTTDDSG